MSPVLPDQVLQRFDKGLQEAIKAGEHEPSSMCLATRDADFGVSARMVLLKEHDSRGFVFYTNTESNKGRQLAEHPVAALTIHWKTVEQQVRIEGVVEPVSDEQADAYFASRPRGSQLGAWASDQSRPMKYRGQLLQRVAAAEARYLGKAIPRPPHWSGFRVVPRMVEFWYGRKSRLHDRIRYDLKDGEWRKQRLFP